MSLPLLRGHVRFFQPSQVFQKSQIFATNTSQNRSSHISSVPVLFGDSDRNVNHGHPFGNNGNMHALTNVTIVDSADAACSALKALIEAAEQRRYVSWSVQKWQPVISNKGMIPVAEITLSAYAGDDFDFGNGPHLFVRSCDCGSRYMNQFRRYFTLNEAKHVWYDYSASLSALDSVNIQPKGLHRDVHSMADLITAARPGKTAKFSGIHSLAEAFISNQCDDSTNSTSLQERSFLSNVTQPWDQHAILPGAHIASNWIKMACYEAVLLYVLHEKLCQTLRNIETSGRNSLPEYKNELQSMLDIYDNFFRFVNEALLSIENNGVKINAAKLEEVTSHLRKQQAMHEKTFLEWASSHCPDAKYMDPQNSSQLRQLLFAPFTNSVNKKTLPSSKLIKVLNRIDTGKVANVQKKRSCKREIELKGLGLTPFSLMKSGWPSTSITALSQMVKRADNNDGLCMAINSLISANGVKLRANRLSKTSDDVCEFEGRHKLRHHYGWDRIGVCHLSNGFKLNEDIRNAISAQEGNKLLLLKYQRLRLWALAQLSGCSSLQERVESDRDITSTGSVKLFESINEMFANGEIVINSSTGWGYETTENSDCTNSVQHKCPQAYELTRKLDSAFKYGGGVGGSGLISSLTGHRGVKSKELRSQWYNGHPGVEMWHTEWRDMTLKYGFAETMMGRRHMLKLDNEKPRRNIDKALTESMRFVLGGSACEAVMGSVTRLVTNEQLHGLGWHVVMVNDDTIVLEGPEYSLETALPVIRYDATKPFSVNNWVKMPISGAIVSSIDDLLPLSLSR